MFSKNINSFVFFLLCYLLQCSDEVALRLQRCQLLQEESNAMSGFGFGGFGSFDIPVFKPKRLGLDTFKVKCFQTNRFLKVF